MPVKVHAQSFLINVPKPVKIINRCKEASGYNSEEEHRGRRNRLLKSKGSKQTEKSRVVLKSKFEVKGVPPFC